MKRFYISKFIVILIIYSQNSYVVIGQDTVHSTAYSTWLEKIKMSLDKGMHTGILLTDLSRAFDCISHELLIAKLYAYGFL